MSKCWCLFGWRRANLVLQFKNCMWKCWQDLMWIQFVLLLRVGGWGWVVKCIQTSSRLFMTLKCSNMSFIFFKWVLTKTNEFCSIILNKNEEAFSHTISFYFWSLQVFIQNTYLLKHFLKEIYWVLHSKPKVDYIIFTFSLCYNLLLFQQAAMFILWYSILQPCCWEIIIFIWFLS